MKPDLHLMAGYLGIETSTLPETYNAGFSMYVAAWPLMQEHPGEQFQTGLFGTWMFSEKADHVPGNGLSHYSDIEGGLGWWRDTRFPTTTPKFIMGGVARGFSAWANGPGAGKGRDWDNPAGHYGVAQISPYILWPPDGLNLKQGTCGEWWGYGYLNLPLMDAKDTTAGQQIPTGGNCWTLYLETETFKGPVAFFTPYFFSRPTVDDPSLAGMFLDSSFAKPNRKIQMETQYIPCVQGTTASGETYARIQATSFPRTEDGTSPVVQQITAYSQQAIYQKAKAWLKDHGEAPQTPLAPENSATQTIEGENRASWAIFEQGTPRDERITLDWKSIAHAEALDPYTYGYRWASEHTEELDTNDGSLVTLPEYYKLVTDDNSKRWVAVDESDVPAETGLFNADFSPEPQSPWPPYETPTDPKSCWKTPGPVSGPFEAHPGDGTTVEYYWYRFADQPAILNADLSNAEREMLQLRIEKLHHEWNKDTSFFAPPKHGKLAEIDSALVVNPPEGLEIGYVPIVTWQGMKTDKTEHPTFNVERSTSNEGIHEQSQL